MVTNAGKSASSSCLGGAGKMSVMGANAGMSAVSSSSRLSESPNDTNAGTLDAKAAFEPDEPEPPDSVSVNGAKRGIKDVSVLVSGGEL
jgi:hypothetical protein